MNLPNSPFRGELEGALLVRRIGDHAALAAEKTVKGRRWVEMSELPV